MNNFIAFINQELLNLHSILIYKRICHAYFRYIFHAYKHITSTNQIKINEKKNIQRIQARYTNILLIIWWNVKFFDSEKRERKSEKKHNVKIYVEWLNDQSDPDIIEKYFIILNAINNRVKNDKLPNINFNRYIHNINKM